MASMAAALLMRMPCLAARPNAIDIAIGVESPRAHGQVTMSRAVANSMPVRRSARSDQSVKLMIASTITTTTNLAATRSANCTIGALSAVAEATSAMSLAARVESPTALTRTTMGEPMLVAPAMTSSPSPRAIGRDSPVRSALSTWVVPFSMWPSTGIDPPASTRTRCPTSIASIGTRLVVPSSSRRSALVGVSVSMSST